MGVGCIGGGGGFIDTGCHVVGGGKLFRGPVVYQNRTLRVGVWGFFGVYCVYIRCMTRVAIGWVRLCSIGCWAIWLRCCLFCVGGSSGFRLWCGGLLLALYWFPCFWCVEVVVS